MKKLLKAPVGVQLSVLFLVFFVVVVVAINPVIFVFVLLLIALLCLIGATIATVCLYFWGNDGQSS